MAFTLSPSNVDDLCRLAISWNFGCFHSPGDSNSEDRSCFAGVEGFDAEGEAFESWRLNADEVAGTIDDDMLRNQTCKVSVDCHQA